MTKDRREFFRSIARKSAGLAACAAPSIMTSIDFYREIKALGANLNKKLIENTSRINERMNKLSGQLDTVMLRLEYQQFQLIFIFLLLVVSFAMDFGLTFASVAM